jgi:D-inositol-3-phosphate glycosyltransferase
VDVFTRSQDEHVPHVLHDLGYGNRVVHIPAGPEQPSPKKQLPEYIPDFVQGIQRFAREKGLCYDLIHSHYWMSGLAAEILSNAWGGIPIIQMFHTLGEMKNRIAQSDDELESPYRLESERHVMARADRIVAATLAEKAQLEWLYKADSRKITIIPPGVDTGRFYPIPKDEAKQFIGIPNEDRMVLFVGRIEPLKGIDTLIRAMSYMAQENSECPTYLAIIGGDPSASPDEMSAEMSSLQQLCRDLHMDRTVVFLGKRGQDTLPYYYSAAEVLVMPSFYESFGMVALEAMACGTPVVASQVGGLAFLVQDGTTGYHVPGGDSHALYEKLSILLHNDQTRQMMGTQAAQYAQAYRWDKIAEQIVAVYESLLQERPHLGHCAQ